MLYFIFCLLVRRFDKLLIQFVYVTSLPVFSTEYIYIYNISVRGYIVEALWYELTLSEEVIMQGLLGKMILIEIKIEQKNYSGFYSLQHHLMNSSNFNYTLMTPGTLKDLMMNSKQFQVDQIHVSSFFKNSWRN